jgi:hypothetical protein
MFANVMGKSELKASQRLGTALTMNLQLTPQMSLLLPGDKTA